MTTKLDLINQEIILNRKACTQHIETLKITKRNYNKNKD